MTIGLPGSGKSTWALEQVRKSKGKVKRVNKDSLRAMVDGGVWSKKNEKFIVTLRDFTVGIALADGCDVIVDDTNFDPSHEVALRRIAGIYNADFRRVDFRDVPLEVCIERDLKRAESVGADVIKKMWRQYLKPPLRPYVEGRPGIYLCDIDGTLADISHRSPYDTAKCLDDDLNLHVADLIKTLKKQGENVVYFSGRSDKFRRQTGEWLWKHGLLVAEDEGRECLFMRQDGDNRKDSVVKRALFENHIEGRYNVKGIIDDRPQVIRMWRYELGLPVFDVGDGIEF
jgi:predicted kinase